MDETRQMPRTQASVGPEVPFGLHVALLVSRGPGGVGGSLTEVPDATGMRQAEALEALQKAGFEVEVLRNANPAFAEGAVSHQLPTAGSAVSPGSLVSVIVSSGPAPEDVAKTVLPDVVGKTVAEATAVLEGAGLKPSMLEEFSPTVPEGTVFAQEPNPRTIGRVPAPKRRGWLWAVLALIVVVVAAYALFFMGGEQVVVPDVTGMTLEEAEVALIEAGLALGRESEEATEAVEPGLVISQEPVAGESVSEGTRVNIVVARPLEGVEVPDVVGLPIDDAIEALEEAGLTVRAADVYSEDVEEGYVAEQSPQPGTRVEGGAEIALSVSMGPEPPANVEVPNLSGMTQDEAEEALGDVELAASILEAFSETVPLGEVVNQTPSRGTIVAPGTRVAVIVSRGPAPADVTFVEVPDVDGLQRDAAQRALSDVGFGSEFIDISERPDERHEEDRNHE
jgi:beta-lactam-binding protein with PASTA domain